MEKDLTLLSPYSWHNWQKKSAKYFEVVKISFLEEIVYPLNLVTDGIVIFINIWIYLLLYKTGFALTDSTSVNGLTIPMVIWILTLAKALQESRITAPSISESIQDGTFVYKISRPYSFVTFSLFRSLGQTLPYLISNILISIIFCLVIIGPIGISFISLLSGCLLFFFGFMIDFYISMMIGLAGLWIEKTESLWWLYSKLKLTLGGVIIPIAFLPGMLQKIADYLPFSQIFYAPIHIIFQFNIGLFSQYFLTECFWVLILGLGSVLTLKKGMKYVASNGG